MKQFITLILSFLPWIAFLVLAGHSLVRLEIALVVAAILTVGMAVCRFHRGAIMWAGFVFFAVALILVLGFKNMWFIQRIGLFANATLLFSTIIGMLCGKPFTEEYAKAEVPQEVWSTAGFIKASYVTTTLWMLVFLINFLATVYRMVHPEMAEKVFTVFNYSVLLGGVIATNIYTGVKRKQRKRETMLANNID